MDIVSTSIQVDEGCFRRQVGTVDDALQRTPPSDGCHSGLLALPSLNPTSCECASDEIVTERSAMATERSEDVRGADLSVALSGSESEDNILCDMTTATSMGLNFSCESSLPGNTTGASNDGIEDEFDVGQLEDFDGRQEDGRSPFIVCSGMPKLLPGPFCQQVVTSRCRAVVHRNRILITAKCSGQWQLAVSSGEFPYHGWIMLSVPNEAVECHGLISENDTLYFLFSHADGAIYLYALFLVFNTAEEEFEFVEILTTVLWDLMPSAQCPVQLFNPAFFASRDSLVLVGGHDGSSSVTTVCEYSLTMRSWFKHPRWPPLQLGVTAMQPVNLCGLVHLFGGNITENLRYASANRFVWTMSESVLERESHWFEAMPATRRGDSGVCAALDHIITAGGFEVFGQSSGWACKDIYAYNMSLGKWERLSELIIARCRPAVVFLNGFLIIVGGFTGSSGYTGSLEFLHLSLQP